ncbi:MAG: alpha/beta fold hydrolase [Longimicrobiales bacterium]
MTARPVERHHVWIPTDGGAVAACLHLPADRNVRAHPVVICPPFGYEYTHAHRSLLHLADDLAAAGFLAVRLDYVGTGDSEGDASTPDLLERWVASITATAADAGVLTGGGPATLIGLRFGALLAGLAAGRVDVHDLVAWHPVSSGKRYIREHEALQSVAAHVPQPSTGKIEAGGFVLSAETAQAVRSVDLSVASFRVRGSALVVERDDLPSDGRLAERLGASGLGVETMVGAGYLGMMAEPQYTVVPQGTLDSIVAWLSARDTAPERLLEGPALDRLLISRTARWSESGTEIVEEMVSMETDQGTPLVGVLTAPAGPSTGAVVLANSGSVHHVGPNRLYVELSRALARGGVACLRLDLRNLGDSRLGDCANENHPYPATAVEDVRCGVDWLRRQRHQPSCVVAGLCSGAYTAFHAGLDPTLPIHGVVCLNPLTFQWQDGMSLDTPDSHRTTRDAQYYKGAVRNWGKWKRLLTGQANTGYIIRFAAKRARDVLKKGLENAAERVGLRATGLLGRRLEQYRSRGLPLTFVFSTRDPGHAILTSEAGPVLKRLLRQNALAVSFIEGADHTFSREAWRVQASEAVSAAVATMHGAGAQGR